MNTLGNNTKTKMPLEESYALALGFPASVDLALGNIVSLKDDGTLEKVADKNTRPFGVIVKGGKTGERVTVLSQFCAKISAKVTVDVKPGDEICFEAVDSVDATQDTFSKAATGNFVTAIALTDTAAGSEAQIGILRTTYKK